MIPTGSGSIGNPKYVHVGVMLLVKDDYSGALKADGAIGVVFGKC